MRKLLLLLLVLIAVPAAAQNPVSISQVGTTPVTTTLPVSAASLPLPAGASTAAKQPALGTAGSPSSDVITMQGIASMTPLKVDGSAVTQPISAAALPLPTGAATDASVTGLQVSQGSATAGEKGGLAMGAVLTSHPTYTTGQTSPASLTTRGGIRIDIDSITTASALSVIPAEGVVGTGTLQSAVTANGNGSAMGTGGDAVLFVTVNCSGCAGGTTVSFQAGDTTPNYVNVLARQVGTNTIASSTTAAGITEWEIPITGFGQFQAPVSNYSAGTVTVSARTSVTGVSGLVENSNLFLGGSASATGTGAVGSTTQRMAVGTDTATIAGSAPGTAGTPSSNVVSIQGVASGTVVPISGTITANLGTVSGLFLDATFTGRMPAGASPANGESNTSTSLSRIGSYNFVYNGSTWDRWTGAVTGSGNFTVTQGTGTNLHMVCDSGCSGSAGFADNAAFTYGTTAINPIGGVLDDVSTNTATENSAAVIRITPQKGMHVNFRNQAGTEIGTASNPIQVSLANTASNATAVKVDGSAVTQPVSGTVTTTPPSNASTNVAQFGGTNVSTGTGAGGAGIPRFTMSNDSSLAANQSVNTAQVNGVTTLTGTGAVGTGAQRIAVGADTATIAGSAPGTAGSASTNVVTIQGIASMTKLLVTPDSVALPANQSVNESQINGVTPLMDNGVSGTGAQRVVIASNNTPFSVNANLTVGGTTVALGKQLASQSVPVVHASDDPVLAAMQLQTLTLRPRYVGTETGTFARPLTSTGDAVDVNIKYVPPVADACAGRKRNVPISQTGNTLIVSGVPGFIAICSWQIVGADAENISVVEGTGSTCGTGTLAVIGGATAAAGMNFAANGGVSNGAGVGSIAIQSKAGNDLCIFQSAAGRVSGNMMIAVQQ